MATTRPSRLSRAASGLCVAALTLVLLGCGQTNEGSGAAPPADVVYRLSLRAVDGPGKRTEWVEPQTGRWRIEQEGETIIFTGDSYVTVSESDGVAVRTGSPAYLGFLVERAISRRPLRSYVAGRAQANGVDVKTPADGKTRLEFRSGHSVVAATIEETLSPVDAERQGLFSIPAPVRTTAREAPVGVAASLPVRAYWLGPAVKGRTAVFATEHFTPLTEELLISPGWSERDEAIVHSTFYELPSARGVSSALPGQEGPEGEIRVVSQPIAAVVSQVAIRAYNGRNGDLEYKPWPRETVQLANGEQAVVIADRADGIGRIRAGFAVITETTLINVVAPIAVADIAALARQLRPL
jgi:hypothetical protein